MNQHWAESYVGCSYDDLDCVGLVELVAMERFGKNLTLPSERNWREMEPDKARKIAGEMGVRIQNPVEGDIVLMGVIGDRTVIGSHVGMFVAPGGHQWVLHAIEARGTILQPLNAIKRLALFVEGIYRWN